MKILDRYIVTSFFKTFVPIFMIVMVILLLQTVWLFISDLAGKDLDSSVIMMFFSFAIPRLTTMVLPLSIMLSSIMVFADLSENYEFVAIKSSGISLLRSIKILSIFILLISIGAFIFANTILPNSERKFINFRKNIAKMRPAMAITPNQFNELGAVNMRVKEKYGEKDNLLKDILIHKTSDEFEGNLTIIKAEKGKLEGSLDGNSILLTLENGSYYDDLKSNSDKKNHKYPFVKTFFDQYEFRIDLSGMNEDEDLNKEQYKKGYTMLNVVQLQKELDTLSKRYNKNQRNYKKEISNRSGIEQLDKNIKLPIIKKNKDSLKNSIPKAFKPKRYGEYWNNQQHLKIIKKAKQSVIRDINYITNRKKTFKDFRYILNRYEISLHDKYVFAFSCFLLFLMGASLGSIIKKQGVVIPILIGILVFLTFHFIGIFAKNTAKDGKILPFIGTWLNIGMLILVTTIAVYRGITDKALISISKYTSGYWKFRNKLKAKKEKKEK